MTTTTIKAGYKMTEIGVIPEDWEAGKIGDCFDFKNGLNKEKSFFGKGTPIVNYMDIYNHKGLKAKDIRGKVTLSYSEIKAYEVKKGDMFFTRTSETVEEIGMASVLLEDVPKGVFSGFILRARPKNNLLDDEFKKYCFHSNSVRKEISSKSSYTTRALTNGRLLSSVPFPLPPKPEQQAIATVLSDTDELIRSLSSLIAKKRQIKEGAMQELLTGKKRLTGYTGEWEVKKLGEVIYLQGGYAFKSDEFTEIGIPIIRISDVESNQISIENSVCYKAFNIPKAFIARRGDALIAMSGATTGKIGVYNKDRVAYINQRVGKFVVLDNGKTSQEFISHLVRSEKFTEGLTKEIAQGAQPNISGKQIQSIELPIPPTKEEQQAIAEILSDMNSEIIALEQKREKYRLIKQGMMQQLLTGKIRIMN